jgi:hypothetical protein
MPTLQEILQPRRDIERRAVGRTTINRDVLMFFTGQDRIHPCLRPRRNQSRRVPSAKRSEHRAFRIRHFVRQFPHDASVSPGLARW